jgi:hypothetical protein
MANLRRWMPSSARNHCSPKITSHFSTTSTHSDILRLPNAALRKGLFDHLVSAAEHRQRHFKPERFGGLEIDDQF